MITTVTKVSDIGILFANGIRLESQHFSDCCETHYLNFSDLTLEDFEGLEFNFSRLCLAAGTFFRRVEGYGIELLPISGWSVKIAGHGYNNGYYSDQLDLLLIFPNGSSLTYPITECQLVDY